MKIYVVTEGEYSSYHIEAVFTDREKAFAYAILDPYRNVEEYTADQTDVSVDMNKWLLVVYDVKLQYIKYISFSTDEVAPDMSSNTGNCFEFTIPLSNKRVYESIVKNWIRSKVLKKIAEDTLAQYLYGLGISREELLRRQRRNWEKTFRSRYYIMESTASGQIEVKL